MTKAIATGLAGLITVVVGFISYAILVAMLSAMLGPLAMFGFAVASSYSDGAVPALGYAASAALVYVLLLASMLPSMLKRPSARA
jgi:hypothetical protein